MKFSFDANQEHQVSAVNAVVELFDGQPRVEVDLDLTLGASLSAVPNRLDLPTEQVVENLRMVQTTNGLTLDSDLACIEGTADTPDGRVEVVFPNFSVEWS